MLKIRQLWLLLFPLIRKPLPLTNLLKKRENFVCNESGQKAFDKLKSMLCNYPVLQSPDFSQPFSVAVDASDDAAGAVLL